MTEQDKNLPEIPVPSIYLAKMSLFQELLFGRITRLEYEQAVFGLDILFDDIQQSPENQTEIKQ